MYPNLRAEQARKNLTNQQMAELLGFTRNTYESKKKTGKFTADECKKLCDLFSCDFDYLFANN